MGSLSKIYKIISRVPISVEVLPKIRVSRLMSDGHGKCCRCGIVATHVITYTLATENHQVVYSNIFANERMMTADHILPRALGGRDQLSNLQLMCSRCNTKKDVMLTPEEFDLVIKNRSNHIRPGFKLEHMRYVIKRFPSLASLYDLSGQEQGPAFPFKRTELKQKGPSKRKKVWIKTGGLVDNKHPHHPMWGWVRIFERFPELKNYVSFA